MPKKRSANKYYLYNEEFNNETLLHFFANIECHFIADAIQYFKNTPNDTTTVALVKIDGHQFVVKRYNFRNKLHALKMQFRKSHAFRSFLYANYLQSLNVKTIKPVAAIQCTKSIFKREAYFISVFEEGVKGCSYFADHSTNKTKWHQAASSILKTTQQLKENAIYHGDYHFGNFIIVDHQAHLLDFDRISIIKPKKFLNYHNKDLANFKRYLERHAQAKSYFNHIDSSF